MIATAGSGSLAALREAGFEGFRRVAQLAADRCEEIPVARGVYAFARESAEPPQFMERSAGGWYRGEDPTEPVASLAPRWVEGAQVLFLGSARGPGVRSLLQQRIKRSIRFGQGRHIAGRAGASVWQLEDHGALLVAWKRDDDPAALEARMLAEFIEAHGRLPFANLKQESET